MKRVVITGMGIISSIGNNKVDVLSSLEKQKSGIVFSPEMKDFGMKSNVWGEIKLPKQNYIKRDLFRFMNDASYYAYLSMQQAIRDANLKNNIYKKNPRIGLVVGSGNFFINKILYDIKKFSISNYKKIFHPYFSIQTMHSNISACLSTAYNIYGISYSISSACATSASCIGHAVELIRFGKQDLVFAGGSEALDCESVFGFDIMNALSVNYNHVPEHASRAYDINRDGFVVSGGSGILVLEELSHALLRNARIYAEIIGIGMNSSGDHMYLPSKSAYIRVMDMAMLDVSCSSIEYINTHATSTKIGDIIELEAIQEVFKKNKPYISSTKSITGHSLGASGVHEIIYMLLMMNNNFIVPSVNIDNLDSFSKNMNILISKNNFRFSVGMSNTFGFGGVNVSIVIKKYI
ncbi:beta-ketoacyl synthase N-terminal-like domain-containing protein [Buchnera aphidicola]|uniref:beta-ketoacyl synthase N-terminal-like domain-containing protein n=1 Tax=Buchnera aphidicola TaxID=9 RepID=UPI003463AB5D